MLIVFAAVCAILWVLFNEDWAFQQRNLNTVKVLFFSGLALGVWWTLFSRARFRLRWGVNLVLIASALLCAALFRIRGTTGDLVPILEFRWIERALPVALATNAVATGQRIEGSVNDFPQFLGPDRNGVLPGPRLETNWAARPPLVVWRQKIGAAWSGFSVVGNRAITQEQRGESECVTGYDLSTGQVVWQHADPTRYQTTLAGEGPRATPTVRSNRVFALGANGLLNCLDAETGRRIWNRDLAQEPGAKVPDWGFASSPLLVDELVVVHGADGVSHSLYAFASADGQPKWKAGSYSGYASPTLATLAGVRQILAFNGGSVSGHDLATGRTLWERPWGSGNPVCSSPIVIGDNRVVFSSGYGVGAELLELTRGTNASLTVQRVWKSLRLKSKFGHLFTRDGCLFGLDDGMFACVNLSDGSQKWKEGRYGHGQGLLVGEYYLLMAESGELVLLRPTPEASNELARFRVFNSKTWNPIALAGDLLLVRNDLEAACVRLPLAE